MIARLVAAILVTAVAVPAAAGVRAQYSGLSYRPVIEIADNGDLRAGDADLYVQVTAGTACLVLRPGGAWQVMRLADVEAALEALGRPRPPEPGAANDATTPRLIPRGVQRVGGRRGVAYDVEGLASDPIRFVVSDDPALAPIGRGLGHFMTFERLRSRMWEDRVAAARRAAAHAELLRHGTIIGGSLYTLGTVEAATIDPQRMALPARPMTYAQVLEAVRAQVPGRGAAPTE